MGTRSHPGTMAKVQQSLGKSCETTHRGCYDTTTELSISIIHIMRHHKVHVSMATIDLSYLSVYIMRMRQKRETSKLQHSKQQGKDYRHYNYCRSENFCIKNNSRFKFSRYKYFTTRRFHNAARLFFTHLISVHRR